MYEFILEITILILKTQYLLRYCLLISRNADVYKCKDGEVQRKRKLPLDAGRL